MVGRVGPEPAAGSSEEVRKVWTQRDDDSFDNYKPGLGHRCSYLRDVLRVLVARDFKLRYKRSIFGVGWSLLVPLSQFAVLYLVFNVMVPLNIPHYTTYLFAGLLPWTWLQGALLAAAITVVDNRDLVRQAGFPVALLPTTTVLSHLIHFLLAFPILAIFLVKDGYRAGMPLVALPLVIAAQFILVLSFAYIVATLQVRFRDTQYLLGIVLFLLFYLTPVFWDDTAIPGPFQSVMRLNPISILLSGYRAILIRGVWPDPIPLLAVAGGSVMVLLFGYLMFAMARDRFVEEL